jgi:hypothetical protein
MQQVKIFKGLENDLSTLETAVNDWIRKSRASVVSITGNIAPQSMPSGGNSPGLTKSSFPPSDVILVLLYEPPGA